MTLNLQIAYDNIGTKTLELFDEMCDVSGLMWLGIIYLVIAVGEV